MKTRLLASVFFSELEHYRGIAEGAGSSAAEHSCALKQQPGAAASVQRKCARQTGPPLASQSPHGRVIIALLRKINNSRVTRKHGVQCRRLHGCFFFLTSCTVSAAIFFNVFMDDNKQGGSKEPREGTSVHIKNRHTHTNRAKCEYCCPFQLFFFISLFL